MYDETKKHARGQAEAAARKVDLEASDSRELA